MDQAQMDHYYMGLGLEQARLAAARQEVPVGAVVVCGGQVVGLGFNRKETEKDATLHGEMIAIRQACQALGGWRLPDSTLYVTLEPCPMCAGAMVQARITRLVYGAPDPKSGAAGSLLNIVADPRFNHRLQVTAGVREAEAAALLRDFFHQRRQSKGANSAHLSL